MWLWRNDFLPDDLPAQLLRDGREKLLRLLHGAAALARTITSARPTIRVYDPCKGFGLPSHIRRSSRSMVADDRLRCSHGGRGIDGVDVGQLGGATGPPLIVERTSGRGIPGRTPELVGIVAESRA